MSHTFKYPTVAAPTTTLTFERAFFRGDAPQVIANQQSGQTIGGTLMVESFGTGYTVQPLTVQVLRTSEAETDWDDIVTFVRDTVNFGENNFYWTDEDSVSSEVKLMNDRLNPSELATYNEFTFQLRIV